MDQRIGPLSRLVWYEEVTPGSDASITEGYLVPIVGQSQFMTDQPLIPAPVYTGELLTDDVIWGSVSAAGTERIGLEFTFVGRILKAFFGPGGYSRPGGGTTTRHQFVTQTGIPTKLTGQLENVSLEGTQVYRRAKNVMVGGITFTFATDGVAAYDVQMMGTGSEAYTQIDSTPTDDGYSGVSYHNGQLRLDSTALASVQEFSLTLGSPLARTDVAFNAGIAAGIIKGKITPEGRLGLVMDATAGSGIEAGQNFYLKAVNQTNVALECGWSNLPTDLATEFLSIELPANAVSRNGWKSGGEAGLSSNQTFRARRAGAVSGFAFGTNLGTYNVTGTSNVFSVKINGGATIDVTLTTNAAKTAAQIVTELNANVPFAAAAVADVYFGRVRVKSKTTGAASSVQFQTGTTNHCGTLLGFNAVVYTGLASCPVRITLFNAKSTNY